MLARGTACSCPAVTARASAIAPRLYMPNSDTSLITTLTYATIMDDSDSSSLSSAPPTDDEKLAPIFLKARASAKTKKSKPPAEPVSPPRPQRSPSPPHEEVLADNFNIAVGWRPCHRVLTPIYALNHVRLRTNVLCITVHCHVQISI